jgi:predicted ABC-type ATPase
MSEKSVLHQAAPNAIQSNQSAPKHAVIVCGPYGAGKTTFVDQHLPALINYSYHVFSADRKAQAMFSDYSGGEPAQTKQAYKAMHEDMQRAIEHRENIVHETSAWGSGVFQLMDSLLAKEYEVTLVRVGVDSRETCTTRCAMRQKEHGHTSPSESLHNGWDKMLENFTKLVPMAHKVLMYDNSQQGQPQLVAYRDNEGCWQLFNAVKRSRLEELKVIPRNVFSDTDNAKDVQVYLRLPKDDAPPYGLKPVSGKTIFTKPTLLACGGRYCNHESPEVANGYAKTALAHVNSLNTDHYADFQTATITYLEKKCESEIRAAFNKGEHPKDLFANFVDEQLVPLFCENGKRVDVETVKKRFRNINIYAHSFGNVFVQQMGNVLVERMQNTGFSESEIDSATKQILVLTVASTANYMKGKAHFTQINMMHLHDTGMIKFTKNIDTVKKLINTNDSANQPLAAVKFSYDDSGKAKKDSGACEMTICTTNPEPPHRNELIRYNDINGFSDPAVMPEKLDNHGMPTYAYFTAGQYGLILRTIVSSALANGLNNSIANAKHPDAFIPLSAHEDLIKLPTRREFTFDPEKDFKKIAHVIGYDERINKIFGKHDQEQKPDRTYLYR